MPLSRARAVVVVVVVVVKHLPTCVLGYSVDIQLPHLGHVAQHGEDDKARQEARQAVHRAGDQGVSVGVERGGWSSRKRTAFSQISQCKTPWRRPGHLALKVAATFNGSTVCVAKLLESSYL